MTQKRNPKVLACIVVMLVTPPFASAQDASEELSRQLVEIRGQVDDLQNELNLKREEHKNRMAFLTAQQTELEASRDREALRITQLEQELEQMKEQVASAGDTSEALAPVVMQHLAELRQQVRTGFPFKVEERAGELDEIEMQLNSGVINTQRAFNRLWAFIEDELRISRENAIYTQSIELAGENILVEVAKLGTAMMYFQTRDRKYGRAVENSGGWRFELLDAVADQEQVARLFDSLRKQIRQGFFEIPNALPAKLESNT